MSLNEQEVIIKDTYYELNCQLRRNYPVGW
jgi:hypothetical protein